ncbi:serine hydrolase domain-containing protein [Deinococcus fonticola]|uniref:serine hydrolase domain-containing protein n=1 Tax=Deinococcus fonticola TaxID=2528713 RepID=UPI0010757EA7|nr:serine hydrolase domain-containing protein [Deinococcus fonticola]
MNLPTVTRELLERAVNEQNLSGAALGVVNRRGEQVTLLLGGAQCNPEPLALERDFWWDLASLTKPLFTARTVLQGVEAGLFDLDDPLSQFLPELGWMQDTPLKTRTLRQLMTHTAGLPAWLPAYTWGDAETIRARLMQEPFEMQEPGQVVYSDFGYMLLGRVLETVHGNRLKAFPLDEGLTFTPDPDRSVATEHCAWRGRVLRGETHDENAAAQGGVAGHAGLFGTLGGVLHQVSLLLNGGWLSAAAQELATRPAAEGRTTAFVLAQPGFSAGSLASPHSYGHTGFTGTGLWVDPLRGLGWTLLTNRVHPSRHTSIDIQGLRRAVGNSLLAHLP